MAKSQLACKLLLTSIAAMVLGVTAAHNAFAKYGRPKQERGSGGSRRERRTGWCRRPDWWSDRGRAGFF
jgi:hypothetical protein